MSENGFIKLHRSRELEDLIKHFPLAYVLLTIISIRAKRTDEISISNLEKGEALIGDFENYGMTRREYRTSLEKLLLYGFLTTKTTNKGTIAKLKDNRVFDVNLENNEINETANKTPSCRPAAGQQPATNKNDKNERMKETTPPNPQTPNGLIVVEIFTCLKDLPIPEVDKRTITERFPGQESRVASAVKAALKKPRDNLTGYILTVAANESVNVSASSDDRAAENKRFCESIEGVYISKGWKFEAWPEYALVGSLAAGGTVHMLKYSEYGFKDQLKNLLKKNGFIEIRTKIENFEEKQA